MRKRSEFGYPQSLSSKATLQTENEARDDVRIDPQPLLELRSPVELKSGESLVVTWGKEGYQPVKWHGMEVGPFVRTTIIQPGETTEQAYERVRAELAVVARREFELKLSEYLAKIKEVHAKARESTS